MELMQNSLPNLNLVHCTLGRDVTGACISFGSDDLGKMMMVCASHKASGLTSMTVPPPRIPKFSEGWEACEKVWAKWLDSEEARRQREYAESVERDRQSVIDFAKGLK